MSCRHPGFGRARAPRPGTVARDHRPGPLTRPWRDTVVARLGVATLAGTTVIGATVIGATVIGATVTGPAAVGATEVHATGPGKASAIPSAAGTAGAPLPGRAGATITLAQHVSFDGDARAYDLATDRTGTSFVAWIGTDDATSQGRQVSLCTLPAGATACAGGTQVLDPPDAESLSGLRLLVTPAGAVTVLWATNVGKTTRLFDATASPGGRLGAVAEGAAIARNGTLLDAELGPGGSIWTVTAALSGPMQVRDGIDAAPVTVRTPYAVGYARLAFASSTPIIAITKDGGITEPVAYTYRPGRTWTAFRTVAGTWVAGTDAGLAATTSGVRLITSVDNASYDTVVASWTGSGFTRPTPVGGGLSLTANDTFADPSGRLVEASAEDATSVAVGDLADTVHAATFTFPIGSKNTFAGGAVQATTTPRGRGWVAWSYQSASTAPGDRLEIVPIRLAGLATSRTVTGRHGRVTLTGPASCLPAVDLPVGGAPDPDRGWKATAAKLTLDGRKVDSPLDGAALTAGRVDELTASVVFVDKAAHDTVTATVKFRSCPNP
jgi:hypothetical protein